MTLSAGNKLIKCDADGVPVKDESYVLFEITAMHNHPNAANNYEPVVSLKKLDDPKTPSDEPATE
jgi:hypothetical protein